MDLTNPVGPQRKAKAGAGGRKINEPTLFWGTNKYKLVE